MSSIIAGVWNRVSHLGVSKQQSLLKQRHLIFTNRLVLIIFFILLLLFFYQYFHNGWTTFSSALLVGNVATLVTILVMNAAGYSILSRIVLSLMCSIYPFYTTINSKLIAIEEVEEVMYFMPRLYILTSSILPILLFSFREKRYMLIGILGSLFPLAFFDLIHDQLHVGYYQLGFNADLYPTFSAVTLASFIIFLTATIVFKGMNEKINSELISKNKQITKQTNELERANFEINLNNQNLENILDERQKEVLDQAVKFQVYSYKNSHELRAPLAKIMSIMELINQPKEWEEVDRSELYRLLNTACNELDVIVHEINDMLSSDTAS